MQGYDPPSLALAPRASIQIAGACPKRTAQCTTPRGRNVRISPNTDAQTMSEELLEFVAGVVILICAFCLLV